MDADVTWDSVGDWLPSDIRRELIRAMPPEVRGWYTPAEASADGGQFVETRTLSESHPRLLRIGD